jgi:parvulin-like peptidyl-prolyl isomerase
MVLQQMRSMKMFVFWFVAIVFLVGFVFLSDGLKVGKGNGAKANIAGEINGEKVSYEVYNRYVTQLAEMERARFQRDELSTADYDRIESQAWDGIVSDLLVRQEAQKLGIHAQDEEIVATLSNNPPSWVRQQFIDKQGQFDAASFQAALNDPNYNWGPAEQSLRSALPSIKLEKMVRARAAVSEDDVRREYARHNQKTRVHYVGVAWPSIDIGAWTPGDADMKDFYDKHPERFQRGETVTLELLKIAKTPSATDEADAMEDAQGILDEEKKGETFASLAEVYSEDTQTASRGGDLGWIDPKVMPEPLQSAARALQVGQTSAPLRTERGLFILHADSIVARPAGNEVRLRQIFLKPKLSGDTLDSLRTKVLTAGQKAKKDFAGAAAELGVTPQKLDPIENLGFIPGVGFAKRLVDWAFTAAPGAVSDPVGTDDALLIARLVEKHPKGPRAFDEVKDQVRYAVLEQRRKDQARAKLEAVVAATKAGQPLDAAAKAAGLKVEEPAPFTFYDNVATVGGSNEFTAVATTLEPGKTSDVVETPSGSYVIQVLARDPFDENAYKLEREREYMGLLSRRESEVYEAWIKDLRSNAKIVDHRRPRV